MTRVSHTHTERWYMVYGMAWGTALVGWRYANYYKLILEIAT